MAVTALDLSEVTDSLVSQLGALVAPAAPIWGAGSDQLSFFSINVTGNSPDTMRDSTTGDCQLNLYLLHVGQDPFARNTPIFGNTGSNLPNMQQPLALDLSYLLTAYAKDNAEREQQAMSIALRGFHEAPVATPGGQYLTVTLGADRLDDMSRLWQSFAVPYRLSTLFRVAIVLLAPSSQPPPASPAPTRLGLTTAPVVPAPAGPTLFGLAAQVTLTPPPPGSTDPDQVAVAVAPSGVSAGETLSLTGAALDTVTDLILGSADGAARWNVTPWMSDNSGPETIALVLPDRYAIGGAAAVPASLPTPGVYLLSAVAGGVTSNAIPLVVVPSVTGVASPPLLAPDASGAYAITGGGFVPAATQVYLGDRLVPAPAIDPAGTSLQFALPPGLPSGRTAVRIRVDGVDAPPAWLLDAP